MKLQENICSLCFFFSIAFNVLASNEPIKPEGDGTAESPFLFERYENFFWLSENTGCFESDSIVYCKQISDIDASDTRRGYDPETDIYYGWKPINTLLSNGSFLLDYDGQNFSIINPYMGRSGNDFTMGIFTRGFFHLRNIVIENAFFERGKTDYAGCLVGWLLSSRDKNSYIENCRVVGTIKMQGGTGLMCGGLIGIANIEKDAFITISNCFSKTSVQSAYSAGFICEVTTSGELNICKCGSISDLQENNGYNYAGGFIERLYINDGSVNIRDSYSNSNIYGEYSQAGGFINSLGGNTNLFIAEIVNCYSTGKFPNKSMMRPFLQLVANAFSNSFTLTNCYYNLTSFEKEDQFAIGRTEDEMKKASTFENWDFENTWDIDEGESFPYLRAEIPEPSFFVSLLFYFLLFVNDIKMRRI